MTSGAALRRIVVAFDASPESVVTVEAAAELAGRLDAEMTVLFVEDVDLLRLASLPFSMEIRRDASIAPMDTDSLERSLRSRARDARQTCSRITEARRVQIRFEVVRGPVAREILSAADTADLIVLGRGRRSLTPARSTSQGRTARALGSTTACILAEARRTVAVISPRAGLGRPIAAVFDGSEGSQRALDLALRLAGTDHRNLAVFVPAGETAGTLVAHATSIARQAGIVPRFATVCDAESIEKAVTSGGCRALVIDRDCPLIGAGGAPALVERLDCPVFVVG